MLKGVFFFIMLIFSVLLKEYLTPLSFLLIILSSFRLFTNRHLNQISINVICLMIFAYYILTYGRVITPEVGLNFLFNVILLKFMESRKYRDEVMVIFGAILLVASGSLFDKTLMYFSFFTISFFLLLGQFSKINKLEFFTLKNVGSYLKLALLVATLFFIFPRIPNPIPFSLNSGNTGEIGYSPEINISSIERLEENDAKVFWAKLKNEKRQDDLYWRGNVVSETDGWNWTQGPGDHGLLQIVKDELSVAEEYRLFIKTSYLFIFDEFPTLLRANHQTYQSDQSNSFSTTYIKGHSRYFALKMPIQVQEKAPGANYLHHNLSEETVQWINDVFKSQKLENIINEYRAFITKENFRYSWAPGKIRSLQEFFDRKVGFCTHYASSLALILRAKNYPARLVSGFQGGRFNPYGGFYEINQNDAHAWVEVWNGDSWLRIDPTSFIAPERIIMDYQTVVNNNFVVPQELGESGPSFLSEIKFIISQWDFVFYQFMDQWDAVEQLSFFSQFKITRKTLIVLTFVIITLFFFFALWKRQRLSPRELLWKKFLKELEQNGISYEGNFELLRTKIQNSGFEKKELALELLEEFIKLFYAEASNEEMITSLMRRFNQ